MCRFDFDARRQRSGHWQGQLLALALALLSIQPASAEAAAGGDLSITCPRPQTRFAEYNRELRDHFWAIYRDGGATVYCGAQFDMRKRRTVQSKLPINIEHVVPHSQLKRIAGAAADPHNLWPAILEVNAMRENWRLVDDIPGETYVFADRREPELARCDFERQQNGSAAVIEPAPAARGRLARSILHMYVSYDRLRLEAADLAAMLAWHAEHPVSEEERRRNDLIEQLTGVRNPFVDLPEHAGSILRTCGRGEDAPSPLRRSTIARAHRIAAGK